ncbi:ABC-2 transporter permease [Gracilibacillus timonensis]|uniref:ABC-2 transporter permease n=1 Tax=Gracilibacillus timonensis TaxID=1816696 RepID=UPI000826790B|nr:ABC-2 transporter permease [Gracilibacillus timonensis]
MFNLIKKDLIIQKIQLLIFLPFILFFIFFGDHLPAFLLFFIVGMFIPMNGYTYDESAETNILLNSLPYTRKEIIAAKYMGAVVYMVVAMGVACILFSLFNKSYTITDIALGAGLFLLFGALTFPLFYILKRGYISTVVVISFIVFVFISGPIIQLLEIDLQGIINFFTSISTATLYLSGAVITIGLYLISWLVSQFIYQRKAF